MSKESPPSFPPFTLPIMRQLAVIHRTDSTASRDQTRLIAALDVLFPAYWVTHRETQKPDALADIMESLFGREEAKKVQSAASDEGKTSLLDFTNQAFQDGAFGLPWMVCENANGETAGYWGVDHLGQVINFLGLEKPGTPDWKALL